MVLAEVLVRMHEKSKAKSNVYVKKKGHHVSVECKPSVPLSFEVSVNNKIVHSKLKGQGFISTKEKLFACTKKILKILNSAANEKK